MIRSRSSASIPLSLIAFDLDGTLVTTSGIKRSAYLHAMSQFGGGTVEQYERAYAKHGTVNRVEQLRRSFAEVNGRQPDDKTSERLVAAYTQYCRMREGEVELVPGFLTLHRELLHRFPLAVASNAPYQDVLDTCTRLGVDAFFDRLYGHPTNKAAALHDFALRKGITPAAILYVGDRVEDGYAAQEAGARFCLIDHARDLPSGQPGLVTSFEELSAHIHDIEARC